MNQVRISTKNVGRAVCSVIHLGVGVVTTQLFVFWELPYFLYDQHSQFRTR
jgi:hypothetical protein